MARASSSPKGAGGKAGTGKKATPAKKAKPKAKPKAASSTKRSAAQRRRMTAAQRKAKVEEERKGKELELASTGLTGAAKTVENAELYLNVYGSWLKGLTYAALAAKYKLSITRCEQIVSQLRGRNLNVLKLRDPRLGQRIAQDLILKLSNAISEYAELIDATTNDSVKLGAMRNRDAAVESFKDLMQELGYLPKHLGTLRVIEDWDQMIETILDTLEKHGVDMAVQRAIVDAVDKINQRAPMADADSEAEEIQDAVLAA